MLLLALIVAASLAASGPHKEVTGTPPAGPAAGRAGLRRLCCTIAVRRSSSTRTRACSPGVRMPSRSSPAPRRGRARFVRCAWPSPQGRGCGAVWSPPTYSTRSTCFARLTSFSSHLGGLEAAGARIRLVQRSGDLASGLPVRGSRPRSDGRRALRQGAESACRRPGNRRDGRPVHLPLRRQPSATSRCATTACSPRRGPARTGTR